MDGTVIRGIESVRSGCAQCSLQDVCLPAGIGAEDLRRLDRIVRRRRPVARGERLFRLGDPLTALFVARTGAFKTVSLNEDGHEQVVGFHLPGELIGFDALGRGEHRCESIALTTAKVCEVPYDELSDVAAQVPGLQRQLLRVTGQSADRDQDHAALLMRRHADERMAVFLHRLGERYRNIGQSDSRFTLPMSREDIASFVGLAPETISRGFTRLRDDGVIAVNGRRIEILAPEALMRLAHAGVEPSMPRRRRA